MSIGSPDDSNPFKLARKATEDLAVFPTYTSTPVTPYSFQLEDQGRILEYRNTIAGTWTVEPMSLVPFPELTYINVVQTDVGAVTIVPGAGVTFIGDGTTAGIGRGITLYQSPFGGSNNWVLVGGIP